jgi:hypothetical protein
MATHSLLLQGRSHIAMLSIHCHQRAREASPGHRAKKGVCKPALNSALTFLLKAQSCLGTFLSGTQPSSTLPLYSLFPQFPSRPSVATPVLVIYLHCSQQKGEKRGRGALLSLRTSLEIAQHSYLSRACSSDHI